MGLRQNLQKDEEDLWSTRGKDRLFSVQIGQETTESVSSTQPKSETWMLWSALSSYARTHVHVQAHPKGLDRWKKKEQFLVTCPNRLQEDIQPFQNK